MDISNLQGMLLQKKQGYIFCMMPPKGNSGDKLDGEPLLFM